LPPGPACSWPAPTILAGMPALACARSMQVPLAVTAVTMGICSSPKTLCSESLAAGCAWAVAARAGGSQLHALAWRSPAQASHRHAKSCRSRSGRCATGVARDGPGAHRRQRDRPSCLSGAPLAASRPGLARDRGNRGVVPGQGLHRQNYLSLCRPRHATGRWCGRRSSAASTPASARSGSATDRRNRLGPP
jgi:hypothetical protein